MRGSVVSWCSRVGHEPNAVGMQMGAPSLGVAVLPGVGVVPMGQLGLEAVGMGSRSDERVIKSPHLIKHSLCRVFLL